MCHQANHKKIFVRVPRLARRNVQTQTHCLRQLCRHSGKLLQSPKLDISHRVEGNGEKSMLQLLEGLGVAEHMMEKHSKNTRGDFKIPWVAPVTMLNSSWMRRNVLLLVGRLLFMISSRSQRSERLCHCRGSVAMITRACKLPSVSCDGCL